VQLRRSLSLTPVINYLSPEDIAARRDALLSRTRFTVEELRQRAEKYLLSAEEQAILRALQNLDFLESGD
jgi:hypothetical protein